MPKLVLGIRICALACWFVATAGMAQTKPRARDLGVPFDVDR